MRPVLLFLLIALAAIAIAARPAHTQSFARNSQQPVSDVEAEHELLDQANQARAASYLSPLKLEECLTLAARRHAAMMVEHQQLSHQFPGEAGLADRLASVCTLHLDEAAENVAYANSAADAHAGFMRSTAHRENLLHPSYNVVGMALLQHGPVLYVVEDFAHGLPVRSAQQTSEEIAKSLDRARDAANLPRLEPRDNNAVQSEACALAQTDSLRAPAPAKPGQARYILRFTTMQPGRLPSAATKALTDRSAGAFAVGAPALPAVTATPAEHTG